MLEKKLVSIIIPAYNASQFVEETILSVLEQTYSSLELIIVNDGSTDNTLQIIEKLQKKDLRISILSKPNSGVCNTRNLGLKEAKGDFTIFLDADDLWDSTFLESCLTIFDSDNNINAIYTKGQLINEKSERLDKFIEANTIQSVSDILEWKDGFVATPSCTIYRTPLNSEIQKWDPNLSTAADQDYFLQIATKNPIKAINKVLFYYRVHKNNMSKNIDLMEKDHLKVYKKALKNNLFKNFWFKQKCFSNLYLILAGSWWKEGNNKSIGLLFIIKALIMNPFVIIKLVKK